MKTELVLAESLLVDPPVKNGDEVLAAEVPKLKVMPPETPIVTPTLLDVG